MARAPGPKKKLGRKTKLTPAITKRMVEALKDGAYVRTAAQAVGICEDSVFDWIARGEKGEQPFADFAEAVKKARAAGELRDLAVITKASEENWQASAWRLERKCPRRWGRKPDRLNAERIVAETELHRARRNEIEAIAGSTSLALRYTDPDRLRARIAVLWKRYGESIVSGPEANATKPKEQKTGESSEDDGEGNEPL